MLRDFTIQNVTIVLCVHATADKHQRSYAEGPRKEGRPSKGGLRVFDFAPRTTRRLVFGEPILREEDYWLLRILARFRFCTHLRCSGPQRTSSLSTTRRCAVHDYLMGTEVIELFRLTQRHLQRFGNVTIFQLHLHSGPAVAERLVCSPPTKANRAQFPAGSLPDVRKRESCRTMTLAGGFSRGSPSLARGGDDALYERGIVALIAAALLDLKRGLVRLNLKCHTFLYLALGQVQQKRLTGVSPPACGYRHVAAIPKNVGSGEDVDQVCRGQETDNGDNTRRNVLVTCHVTAGIRALSSGTTIAVHYSSSLMARCSLATAVNIHDVHLWCPAEVVAGPRGGNCRSVLRPYYTVPDFVKACAKSAKAAVIPALYGIRHGIFRLALPDFITGLVIGAVLFFVEGSIPVLVPGQSYCSFRAPGTPHSSYLKRVDKETEKEASILILHPERRIGEGIGHGLCLGSIPAFAWSDFGKPWITEIRKTGPGIEPGSSRIRVQHALDDSQPITHLQGNKLRVPYCQVSSNTGYSLEHQPMSKQLMLECAQYYGV
ncbi:hypothetical protein PR048_007732 [Dryococelus australis]|uniref:Uncharacterized protein n=1 Tax=Dryococelus australis TaxID=614101 RepID=A0ABQ9HV95_9NEOP|nr:hypothetical protein PR048_007732 [Dryococelus australis]